MFGLVMSPCSLSQFINYLLVPCDVYYPKFCFSESKFAIWALVNLHLPKVYFPTLFPCHTWTLHNLHRYFSVFANRGDKGITENKVWHKVGLPTFLKQSTKNSTGWFRSVSFLSSNFFSALVNFLLNFPLGNSLKIPISLKTINPSGRLEKYFLER